MKKIRWLRIFNTENGRYGGSFYENNLVSLMKKNFDFSFYDVFDKKNPSYIYNIIYSFFKTLIIKESSDFWVRDYFTTIPLLFKKNKKFNIVLIHHIASTSLPPVFGFLFDFYNKIFYLAVKKADLVVTVSEFWKEFFVKQGCKNVKVISNFVDYNLFDISEQDVLDFKKKYKLEDKPIIYLGNCRKIKGVDISYNLLKNLDLNLVTSGKRELDINAINLDLEYREYLCLLKASKIVLFMSTFEEGWGITAHEAMYLKTPVIGTGLGGNGDLLRGGNQIISTFDDLEKNVLKLLKNPDLCKKLGDEGYSYAKLFPKERFENEWMGVFNSIE